MLLSRNEEFESLLSNSCNGHNVTGWEKNLYVFLFHLLLDEEHYQVPKQNPRPCSLEQSGELYDDIQLLTDFKARQREKPSPDRGVWSRFGSGKKRMFDFSVPTDGPKSMDCEDSAKVTTFQRFMSKVETSFVKSPVFRRTSGDTKNSASSE